MSEEAANIYDESGTAHRPKLFKWHPARILKEMKDLNSLIWIKMVKLLKERLTTIVSPSEFEDFQKGSFVAVDHLRLDHPISVLWIRMEAWAVNKVIMLGS
jgi:hypothetical protein